MADSRICPQSGQIAYICRLVSANGNVTHDELLGAGFDERQITEHFRGALRAARVERMAA